MSEPSTPSLEGFAGFRAASVLWSKLVDAAAVIVLIRALPREDYGIVGLAGGWIVALGFLNISPENILWRDYRALKPRLAQFVSSCVWFWLAKTALLLALAVLVALAQYTVYREPMVLAYLPAAALFSALTTLAFIFETPLAVGLRYRKVAVITAALRTVWLALLATLFWRPSLAWLLIVSAVYYAAHVVAWFVAYRREHMVDWRVGLREMRGTVASSVRDFVLWQHLAAAARAFLMRGDLALLGALGFALANVGDYLVGLNVAAFALILPGVIEMTVTAGLAHSTSPTTDAQILRRASRWNRIIVLAQLAAFQIFGLALLEFLVPDRVAEVFRLSWLLVLGTSVVAIILPRQVYVMVRRSPARFWQRVCLPVTFLAAIAFAVAAWRWGLVGVAAAHVVNGALFVMALVLYLRRP